MRNGSDTPREQVPRSNISFESIHRQNEPSGTLAQPSEERPGLPQDRRSRTLLVSCIALVVVTCLLIISPTQLFEANHTFTLAWWIDSLRSNVAALFGKMTGQVTNNGIDIVACRYIAVGIAGAALAVSGALFQGALGNPLASPTTLGVTSGGMLGVVVWVVAGPASAAMEGFSYWDDYIAQINDASAFDYIMQTYQMALSALVGCFAVVGLVLLISRIAGGGRVNKVALIIAGQVFAAVVGAGVSVLRYWLQYNGSTEQVNVIKSISLGSLSAVSTPLDIALIGVPIGICLVLAILFRRRLNALTLDDMEAQALGIDVERTRTAGIALCTVMTAVVVAFCGFIGFVGFFVPHLCRSLFGGDFNYLVPGSAAIGALYLVVVFGLTMVTGLFGDGLGVCTSVIGAVAFLAMILMRRGRSEAAWL